MHGGTKDQMINEQKLNSIKEKYLELQVAKLICLQQFEQDEQSVKTHTVIEGVKRQAM